MKTMFEDMSFRKQLYVSFGLVMLVSVFTVNANVIFILWQSYQSDIISSMGAQARQIADNINGEMDSYNSLLSSVQENAEIINYLNYGDLEHAQDKMENAVNVFMNGKAGRVKHIKLYKNSIGGDYHEISKSIEKEIRKNYDIVNQGLYVTETYLNNKNERVISLYKKIYTKNRNYNYFVEICLYETEIYRLFNKLDYKVRIERNGIPVSDSERELFDKYLHQIKKGNSAEILLPPTEKFAQSFVCNNGWITYVSAKDEGIWKSFLRANKSIFLGNLLIFIATLFGVWFTVESFNSKMAILKQKIQTIGKVTDRKTDCRDENEFQELYKVLDEQDKAIHELLSSIDESNKKKRDAQMRALRSQINSHFLFNALSSIKWLAAYKEYGTIEQATTNLGFFLHFSLSMSEDFVSVKEEVNYLNAYIFLQKLRYKDEISFHVDIDEGFENYMTTRMVLQPLVENAIYHARRPDNSCLNIVVYGYLDDMDFYLVVEDDGIGMEAELAEELKAGTYQGKDRGYGLRNVMERVDLCTGGRGKVTIESRQDVYTKIILIHPKEI